MRDSAQVPLLSRSAEKGVRLLIRIEDMVRNPHRARRFPCYFGIETTSRCNASCVFCPLHGKKGEMVRPRGVMSGALFEKIAGELASFSEYLHALFLNVFGEPLIDPMFEDRVRILASNGLSRVLDVQTNGQYLTDEAARAILSHGVARVTLGFDGATRETHESHRVGCSYRQVLDNMTRFAELRKALGAPTRITVKFVKTALNAGEVEIAAGMWSGILSPDDEFAVVDSDNWACRRLDEGDVVLRTSTTASQTLRVCPLPMESMSVLYDGNVPACCWDYDFEVAQGSMGNVETQTIADVWAGETFERFREVQRSLAFDGRCAICVKARGPEPHRPLPAVRKAMERPMSLMVDGARWVNRHLFRV